MFRIRIELFYLSPDWPKIWIRIWIHEINVQKLYILGEFFVYIFNTLNTILFGQVPPKPNQKHYLNPISLLMDRSRSGFLKLESGS